VTGAAKSTVVALCAALPLAACGEIPAVLAPHGSNARQTAEIAWVLFVGSGVIFALVAALAAYALFAAPARRAWLGRRSFVVGAGIVFPVVALSALLIYSLRVGGALARSGEAEPLRIEIVGEMWWWRVRYVDSRGTRVLTTANEVHIPVGRNVEFRLASADVLHSFWVPNLAGKLDLIPGRVNVLRVQAERAGVFRGQCAEYCGAQHANMAFHVVAHPAPEFDAWLAAQQLPATAPPTPELARGLALFMANCSACHTVRGTPAAGELGPDLTHVGSRRFIAAGTLPQNVGTIAGWIASSQHVKPGNLMPSFDRLTGEELRALAAFVASLT
jgi:cytochrome c oxidase subunit 2